MGSNPSAPTNNLCICYGLSLCQERLLMDPCASLGILQLQIRLQMEIPMIFMDRYAHDSSMALERRPRGNHLFPRRMRYRHDEGAATLLGALFGSGRSHLWTPCRKSASCGGGVRFLGGSSRRKRKKSIGNTGRNITKQNMRSVSRGGWPRQAHPSFA